MAKIITLISNETKSGKTTIAFNLSILLSRKNKKILLINQEYTSSYLTLIPKAIKSETKNIIAPFSLLKYDRYLSILLFANVKNIIHKYNYAKLFPKQLQLLINQFDYIIIDASYV
jgi:cellulose biosynthesis protein BcsQ